MVATVSISFWYSDWSCRFSNSFQDHSSNPHLPGLLTSLVHLEDRTVCHECPLSITMLKNNTQQNQVCKVGRGSEQKAPLHSSHLTVWRQGIKGRKETEGLEAHDTCPHAGGEAVLQQLKHTHMHIHTPHFLSQIHTSH